jgi:phage terminase small subunit
MTSRQTKFVDEYMLDLNGTRAAIAAGYSPKTAHSIANENLKKPEIRSAIAYYKKQYQIQNKLTKDRITDELSKYAFRSSANAFKDTSPRDAICALEKLTEMLGFNQPDDPNADLNQAIEEAIRYLNSETKKL